MNNANNNRRQFLSKVMKAAWTIYRKGGKTFSQSLKKAWKWAKKNLVEQPATTVQRSLPFSIIRESAKAYQFNAVAECHGGLYQEIDFWLPKSAIENVTGTGVVVKNWAFRMIDEKVAHISGFVGFAE